MAKPSSAAIERHPHLGSLVGRGQIRVDMHTHSMWSGDSTTTPDEFAAAVAASGLDVVCITDHNDVDGAAALAEQLECRVIVGEELRTPAGEIIGLFLTDRIPMGVGHVEAATAIRDQGGIVYIPHPFDPMRRNLSETALHELAEAGLIDAIEVLNSKTSLASLNLRAADFAAEFGIAAGAGSDAHVPNAMGAACVEMPDFVDVRDFCEALRAGTVVGHHWDEPRPWTPRIVPSVKPYKRRSTLWVALTCGSPRVERAFVPIYQAIILGIVQGISEFLPISSSGHLLLVPWLAGWEELDPSVKKSFDVALHMGTLVAVVAYFWSDLVVYVREGVKLVFSRQRPVNTQGRLAWLFVLATIPAALVGALFEDTIDTRLGTPVIIGVSLILFGLVMEWADRRMGQRKIEDLTARDALIIGAAQALALNPGTSRSGITMTAGRAIGFGRDAAVRISFLMSIPVIAGAGVFKLAGLVGDGVPDGLLVPMIVGTITAGLSGWLAVWGTLRIVRLYTFMPFVVYRVVLGIIVLIVAAANWR